MPLTISNKYHIVSFGKKVENLKIALNHRLIGSNYSTIQKYLNPGSTVFLHCIGQIWGTAKVTSPYRYSETEIWKDRVYPHRFSFEVDLLAAEPIELCDGIINVEFRKRFGTGWAYKFIFSPKPIPADLAQMILAQLKINQIETAISSI